MYNLIDYSGIYSKRSESLWTYNRNKPALDGTNNIIYFPSDNNNNNNNNNSISFKLKEK